MEDSNLESWRKGIEARVDALEDKIGSRGAARLRQSGSPLAARIIDKLSEEPTHDALGGGCFTTGEFCRRHHISKAQLYQLWRDGLGPQWISRRSIKQTEIGHLRKCREMAGLDGARCHARHGGERCPGNILERKAPA